MILLWQLKQISYKPSLKVNYLLISIDKTPE
jgi:hypothetical protein